MKNYCKFKRNDRSFVNGVINCGSTSYEHLPVDLADISLFVL